VESFRTLDRARLEGYLDDRETARKSLELARLLDRLHLVPISDELIASARAPFPVSVRALDAIHVATAQWLSGRVGGLEFWTHDERQAIAAMSRGLEVRGTAR
jgi:predicted nucleic acid-binding protein